MGQQAEVERTESEEWDHEASNLIKVVVIELGLTEVKR